jgi:hypothetical protein
MGQLTNRSATGDPLTEVNVIGFEKESDAHTFAQKSFDRAGLKAVPPIAQLKIGESVTFEGSPYVVFYVADLDTQQAPRLLSITRCYGDLPNLNIGSWGWQMTLSR